MPTQYDLPYSGSQVESLLAKIAEIDSEVPTKTSDLQNDSGFITSGDLPTRLSQLQNDAGFVTNSAIPTRTSQLNNDSNYVNEAQLAGEADRAAATEQLLSGRVSDLEGKVPSEASPTNKLADQARVTSAVAAETTRAQGAEGDLNTALQSVRSSLGTDYYQKSQTYNKTEVDNLIAAIKQFNIVAVATLPTASADTMYTIYLIPSQRPETRNAKEEYITIRDGNNYYWEHIGSTSIDLSNYIVLGDVVETL